MNLSLLYKNKESSNTINAIKDFSVDRLVTMICPDVLMSENILKILSNPLTERENIIYRQEVIKENIKKPGLCIALKEALRNLDLAFKQFETSKRNAISFKTQGKTEKSKNETALLRLSRYSIYTHMVYTELAGVLEVLNKFSVESEGFTRLKDFCVNILDSPEYKKLMHILNEINETDLKDTTIRLYAESLDFCAINTQLHSVVPLPEKEYYKMLPTEEKKFSLFKTKNEPKYIDTRIEINMTNASKVRFSALLRNSVIEVVNILSDLIFFIIDNFYNLEAELDFCLFAVKYQEELYKSLVPYSFPEIKNKEADCFNCEALSDSFLIFKEISLFGKQSVIPNDIELASNKIGTLIKGKNNTGKTVFLRSIGIAQLFAQCGLPVSAKKSKISIRNGLFSQFSSAEEKFLSNDVSGRFESEVKEIAVIVNEIQPYSIVFFNETFQSTAFEEGAKGMYDILLYLSSINVKWFFVTHMFSVFDMFEKNKDLETKDNAVLYLKTSDDENKQYKLEAFEAGC